MRYQTYGFVISFTMHAVVVFLLVTFCRFAPHQKKILLVDFTTFSVEKSVVTPLKPAPPPRKTARRVRKKPVVRDKPPIAAIRPEKKKIEPVIPDPEVPVAEIEPVLELPEPRVDKEESLPVEFVPVGAVISEDVSSPAPVVIPGPSPKVEYVQAHFSYIKDLIQEKLNYPGIARKMGWEGKVIVSFIVCADGRVVKIRIIESSGYAVLDKNAVKTIRAASPLPRPPVRAELVIPITYRLG